MPNQPVDEVADRPNPFGLGVGNGELEFLLQLHYQFHDVQRIESEILNGREGAGQLIRADAEQSAERARDPFADGGDPVRLIERTPSDVRRNQSSTPQLGQGASPDGPDGSMQIKASQTGQRFGSPSGVREETIPAMPSF